MAGAHSLSTSVATQVGQLHVESIGTGPTAVLWHSLFVDSRSWHRGWTSLRATGIWS